jgi:hypothetical protein
LADSKSFVHETKEMAIAAKPANNILICFIIFYL